MKLNDYEKKQLEEYMEEHGIENVDDLDIWDLNLEIEELEAEIKGIPYAEINERQLYIDTKMGDNVPLYHNELHEDFNYYIVE
jgi:hypothetical protein